MMRMELAIAVRWTMAAITVIALAAIAAKECRTNEHDVLVAEQRAREVEAQQETDRAWLSEDPDAYASHVKRRECRRMLPERNQNRAALFMACQDKED